jgi:Flp pilus assembly pilin Flp
MSVLREFWREEEGQDLTEYTLLLAFMALACLCFVSKPAPAVNRIWTSANSRITAAGAAANGR